jgi:hypothetical protein
MASNSVRFLIDHGLAAGLTGGQRHNTGASRGGHGQFELNYGGLADGEIHTVYPQQDLVGDLIAGFVEAGKFYSTPPSSRWTPTSRVLLDKMGNRLVLRSLSASPFTRSANIPDAVVRRDLDCKVFGDGRRGR